MRAVPPGPRSARQAIAWWERRRLGYNGCILVSLLAGTAVARFVLNANALPVSTLSIGDILFMGLVSANVMYTFLWCAEIRYGLRPEGPGRSGLTDRIPIAARANQGVRLAMEVALIVSAALAFLLPIWFRRAT